MVETGEEAEVVAEVIQEEEAQETQWECKQGVRNNENEHGGHK